MQNNTLSGVLVINKHTGVTSHDIVSSVRRLFGTRRVGHTGTLDPMATGILIVLIGSAAAASEYITAGVKRYRAGLRLGITTDTGDITGTLLTGNQSSDDAFISPDDNLSRNSTEDQSALPSPDEVAAVCAQFIGPGEQIPPMYSAIKVGGRKLVDLARNGITVERNPRPIEIFSLDICAAGISDHQPSIQKNGNYILDVRCSAGTYIRTLCTDIGSVLGCGGVMCSLERTENAGFSMCDAITISELENMGADERRARLIPVEKLFNTLPIVELPGFYHKLAKNGAEIYQHKINTRYAAGDRVRLYGESKFFALGEVRNFNDGSAVKPIKYF